MFFRCSQDALKDSTGSLKKLLSFTDAIWFGFLIAYFGGNLWCPWATWVPTNRSGSLPRCEEDDLCQRKSDCERYRELSEQTGGEVGPVQPVQIHIGAIGKCRNGVERHV